MKKVMKILLIILVIAIISIMGMLVYKLNNDKKLNNEEISNLNNQIQTLEKTIENMKNEELEPEVENKYSEMTEEDYKKYNSGEYQFKISNMILNGDGTATIEGRAYKEKELPVITKEQYQELLNGNTVEVIGVTMKVSDVDEGELEGHSMLIASVSEEYYLELYLDENEDGTGTLEYYGEIKEYVGTDIYMKITLDENIQTESGRGNITLKEYLKEWVGSGEMPDELQLSDYNTEIVFENGKVVKILFTSV